VSDTRTHVSTAQLSGLRCTGDSEFVKAVFLDSVLRGAGHNATANASDPTSLRRVLPPCSLLCPVTVCYGDKEHYVVCVSGSCDPVVLENAEAVEQLTKQMCTDSEDVGEAMTWITMHLPSHLLQVITLFSVCFALVNSLTGTLKTAEQRTIIQQYGDWYTGR